MITTTATATDFANWTKAAKAADIDSLRFVISDCVAAEKAMRGWNPEKEGYYADQAHTYRDELRRRLTKKGK